MKDWRSEYESKLISAEEAARFVKSGDYIAFTLGREAYAIGKAIANRMDDLEDVKVFQAFPGYHFGWYGQGREKSFKVTIYMPTVVSQEMVDDKRADIEVNDILSISESTSRESDIVITEVSPPDEKGFCSFGASLWNKKEHIKRGKLVLAEVNKNLIRTFAIISSMFRRLTISFPMKKRTASSPVAVWRAENSESRRRTCGTSSNMYPR